MDCFDDYYQLVLRLDFGFLCKLWILLQALCHELLGYQSCLGDDCNYNRQRPNSFTYLDLRNHYRKSDDLELDSPHHSPER
jgi:hypothetical protein